MALEVGSRLGHYNVTALIGEGGTGEVHRAKDTTLLTQEAHHAHTDPTTYRRNARALTCARR